MATPRFTIITASYNQSTFLEAAIRSVLEQHRSDVEHVVLDGGSTDGSVEVLRRYDRSLAYWVSTPDGGQPAAWNAGVRRARGAIVGFLNSDDLYMAGALDEIAKLADANAEAEWLIGGTKYFGEGSGDLSYPGVSPVRASQVLYFEAYAPQPGHFWRRALIDRVGPFDETMRFSFDLDFFVRCALAGARAASTSRVIAAFRFHAASKTATINDVQVAETRAVEARHWPAIERRDGVRARLARANYHGHLALRDVRLEKRSGAAWRHLGVALRRYPSLLATRALYGTIQRLLGLR